MNHAQNPICKVCLCSFIDIKPFVKYKEESLQYKEVIAPCASVQTQKCDAPNEQICVHCSKSFKPKEIKIKAECDEIYIEETEILNICNSREAQVKQEETQSNKSPVPFKNVESNSFYDDVKIECDIIPLENSVEDARNNEEPKNIRIEESSSTKDFCNKEARSTFFENQLYQCYDCDKQFRYKSHLIEHVMIHSGEKPFRCDICDKSFHKLFNLKRHKQLHIGEKQYNCDICSKAFYYLDDLNNHQRKSHALYKCEVCPKYFLHLKELKKHHQISHTEEKPFKCDICSKGWFRLFDLTKHRRIHTGEKPFKCDICDKKFCEGSTLNQHKKIHLSAREKRYKCDVCCKSLFTLKSLKVHQRTHTGETPFKCDLCDKQFSVAHSLKLHRQVHTGEKPYKCDVCDRNFSQGGHLKAHMQRKHFT